jgi:phage terminase small subunit
MPRRSAASMHFPTITRMERLAPPPELNPDERAVFLNVVANNPADHFRPSDAVLLCVHVRAVLAEREAAEHLATQGRVSIDNKLSAWVTVQQQAIKTILSTSRALKLTPAARRPNPSRPGKPVMASYYDRMAAERLAQTESDGGDGAA